MHSSVLKIFNHSFNSILTSNCNVLLAIHIKQVLICTVQFIHKTSQYSNRHQETHTNFKIIILSSQNYTNNMINSKLQDTTVHIQEHFPTIKRQWKWKSFINIINMDLVLNFLLNMSSVSFNIIINKLPWTTVWENKKSFCTNITNIKKNLLLFNGTWQCYINLLKTDKKYNKNTCNINKKKYHKMILT